MANPTISVVRSPAGVVTPGTQVTFTVTATDADARTVSYVIAGRDLADNEATVIETIVVSDPVTVTVGVDDPSGTATTPVRDAVDPRVWRSTV